MRRKAPVESIGRAVVRNVCWCINVLRMTISFACRAEYLSAVRTFNHMEARSNADQVAAVIHHRSRSSCQIYLRLYRSHSASP